jgi:hypothetical protein
MWKTAEKACLIRWLGRPFNETIQLPDFADELDGDRPRPSYGAHAQYAAAYRLKSQASPEYWIVRPSAQLRTRRTMTAKYDVAISQPDVPALRLLRREDRGRRGRRVPGRPAGRVTALFRYRDPGCYNGLREGRA